MTGLSSCEVQLEVGDGQHFIAGVHQLAKIVGHLRTAYCLQVLQNTAIIIHGQLHPSQKHQEQLQYHCTWHRDQRGPLHR